MSNDLPVNTQELSLCLQEREPSVRLVRERHLRQVLHRLVDEGEPIPVNTELPLWINRDRLQQLWSAPDSIISGDAESYLLLAEPDDRLSETLPKEQVLLLYWRLLVRGSVSKVLHRQLVSGSLTEKMAAERLRSLDMATQLELRHVLQAEHVVLYGDNDLSLYLAWIPLLADLDYFEPLNLRWIFPTLEQAELRRRILDETGIPLAEIRDAMRPAGAADPDQTIPLKVDQRWEIHPDTDLFPETPVGKTGLLARAVRMAERGNVVRAAILRVRAARQDEGERETLWKQTRSSLRDKLITPLAAKDLLDLDYDAQQAWLTALLPLLEPATRRLWPRAARALYELQRIVRDLQGEIATVDPIEWIRSGFRRPLHRTLTRARDVILLRHLLAARKHLLRTPLDPTDRDRLDHLLAGSIEHVEERVRTRFGPIIVSVLEESGLQAASVPQEVAREKLVAELLDRVCERGFLRIGDLRDAVARNQLKMPDLQGPREFLAGDPLLKADARLDVELDGVYRRGEFYLRWIQRGTAVGFGTPFGRRLSKYVAFPFLGAFLIVEFAKYIVMEFGKVYEFFHSTIPPEHELDDWKYATIDPNFIGPMLPASGPTHAATEAHHSGISLTPESIGFTLVIGFLILGICYWPSFRHATLAILNHLWVGLRFTFLRLPMSIWQSSPVRLLRHNPITRFVIRYFGTALFITAYVSILLFLLGAGPVRMQRWAMITFGVSVLVVNTPFGRRWEDNAAEAFTDTWRVIRGNLIPGLLSSVLWLFRELMGVVERSLYAVDEWFRFRQGQGHTSLTLKAMLAVVWFPIAYCIRFAFNLLLEPQINPVKHFPVVTVSHKLLLPMIPGLAESTGLSIETATALIAGIPGIFGFIVWELKENWRLYEANRTEKLSPVVLGHHGETMRGLLRPGFHSGTVPSLYRKLRGAVRKQSHSLTPIVAGKIVHELEDVSHAIDLFVQRELMPLLRSNGEPGLRIYCRQVRVRVQSIEIVLGEAGHDESDLTLAFDHQHGEIQGRLVEAGWFHLLNHEQRRTLRYALQGLCYQANALPPLELQSTEEDGPTWREWEAFWNARKSAG